MVKNYKLFFIASPDTDLIYYGITTQKLTSFKANITNKYKNYLFNNKGSYSSSYVLLSFKNPKIYLLEELTNITKEQANTQLYNVLQGKDKAINNIINKNFLIKIMLFNNGFLEEYPDYMDNLDLEDIELNKYINKDKDKPILETVDKVNLEPVEKPILEQVEKPILEPMDKDNLEPVDKDNLDIVDKVNLEGLETVEDKEKIHPFFKKALEKQEEKL